MLTGSERRFLHQFIAALSVELERTRNGRTTMWLQLPAIGHLSVVLAKKAPGSTEIDFERVMIRARKREHLDNLRRACATLRYCDIVETRGGDYRFRLIAKRADFADALFDLAMNLRYSNVKGEAQKHQAEVGTDFVDGLHRVWAIFGSMQPRL